MFFISVFFHFFFFWLKKSLKNLTYVSRQCTLIIVQFLVCILTVVAYTSFMVFSSRLSFTVSMFIAHATELVHRSTSMYQWPCPFRTSYYCFTILVFIMISATVIGLRLDSDIVFFLQFLTEKNETFLHQRHLRYKYKKERKISGVVWALLDTTSRTPNDHGDMMQV